MNDKLLLRYLILVVFIMRLGLLMSFLNILLICLRISNMVVFKVFGDFFKSGSVFVMYL